MKKFTNNDFILFMQNFLKLDSGLRSGAKNQSALTNYKNKWLTYTNGRHPKGKVQEAIKKISGYEGTKDVAEINTKVQTAVKVRPF